MGMERGVRSNCVRNIGWGRGSADDGARKQGIANGGGETGRCAREGLFVCVGGPVGIACVIVITAY